jgi:undecaprenyl diphosphate synthase
MDGNGRWARQRHLPRFAGHRAGLQAVRKTIRACAEHGVEVLTLFAFSSENWRRPKEEVGLLMNLFLSALDKEVSKLHENNIRLRIIGDVSAFSAEIQQRIEEAEALTKNNTALQLNIAANYGGRWDIAQACRCLAKAVQAGDLTPEAIDPEAIQQHLSLASLPEPDLFIRSGGEQRISNFLLWQLAYTELYFTDLLWPDFDKKAFAEALDSFASRQRRFGRTGEQVEAQTQV